MTKNIEIKGYESLAPNSVWGKDSADVTGPNGAPMQTKELFVALRYETPSQEGVFNLIERTAKDYLAGKYEAIKPTEKVIADERALTQIFRRFEQSELEAIASRNSDIFEYFKGHFPKDTDKSGTKYLRVTTGILSLKTVETMPAELKALGAQAYETVLQTSGKNKMSIRIKLESNNALPEWSRMNYLLTDGVTESKTLSARPHAADYTLVENKVIAVYSALDSAQKVEKLPDLSDAMNLAVAAVTLNQTLKCLEQSAGQMMVIGPDQLDAVFGQLLGNLPGKKGQKKQQ